MEKTLLAYCKQKYSVGDRVLRNGVQNTEESIFSMIQVIVEVFKEGGVDLPPIKEMRLSADDFFSLHNPGDIVGIVFDAVTSQNRNPQLWFETAVRAEISSTISTMLYGPNSLVPDRREGVNADRYPEAFDQLIKLLDKRYSLFR